MTELDRGSRVDEVRDELFRMLAERSGNLISRVDARGVVIYISPSARTLLGYEPEEMIGHRASEWTHPDDLEHEHRAFVLAASSGGELPMVTSRVRKKDGTYVFIESTCYIVRDAAGAITDVYTSGRDVTARAEAELAAERSAESLRSLLEALPEPAVVHDRGTIVTVNQAFVELMRGASVSDFVGKHALEHVHPDDRAFVLARLDSTMRNRRAPEHRLVARDGTAIPVEVTGVPCIYDGRVAALAIVHDLRARKRVEAELAAADRMASLGYLAAAVGHEINNPLTYVSGALELLARDLPGAVPDASTAAALLVRIRDALDGVGRVRDIVRDLRGISTPEHDEFAHAIDLHRVLDLAAATADHEINHHARLVRVDGEIAPVAGIEGRLIQVFVNLLINAAQAIPDGDAAANEIRIVTRMADPSHVVIEVIDSGLGLPPGEHDRSFDPFVSGRRGTGSGLGLSISQRIVTSLGGTLEAEPREPHGACFRVTLPAAERPAVHDAPAIEVGARPERGRVLFADDEPLIRNIAAAALVPHEVVLASSGREVIALLERGERFDAIVCDLQMPDLGGVDVHEWMVAHCPELAPRLMFISGGAFTERARAFLAGSRSRILRKPFDLSALGDAVNAIVAGAPTKA